MRKIKLSFSQSTTRPASPTTTPIPTPYKAAAHPVGAALALPSTNVPAAAVLAAPPKVEHCIDSADTGAMAPCCVIPPPGPETVTPIPPPSKTPVHFADSN
ncbi:hypothetical protein HO173_007463 [Letharia columbiana]|uniref:Uncharacterized protein n=1 Tax=Letharia columbiana TaxID=112416 RepID=A0A8H6FTL7_9LECA|nr:uncharacterized protein HO173_007463 [Letharia columbiana]KAF6234430.1 hypothetical protein HO173_007463 [Letharia columbiana]